VQIETREDARKLLRNNQTLILRQELHESSEGSEDTIGEIKKTLIKLTKISKKSKRIDKDRGSTKKPRTRKLTGADSERIKTTADASNSLEDPLFKQLGSKISDHDSCNSIDLELQMVKSIQSKLSQIPLPDPRLNPPSQADKPEPSSQQYHINTSDSQYLIDKKAMDLISNSKTTVFATLKEFQSQLVDKMNLE